MKKCAEPKADYMKGSNEDLKKLGEVHTDKMVDHCDVVARIMLGKRGVELRGEGVMKTARKPAAEAAPSREAVFKHISRK
jgi:hypothetical protein